jgi:hypothetical protein
MAIVFAKVTLQRKFRMFLTDKVATPRNITITKRHAFWLVAFGLLKSTNVVNAAETKPNSDAPNWANLFALEVDRRLEIPLAMQKQYLAMADLSLAAQSLQDIPLQALLIVDRSAQVQAAMLAVREQSGKWFWIGASPVSTGKVGKYEHFLSPLGVFAHTLDNPDYRAEGTFNKNNIQGYGIRGRRVFDFGWQIAERGWGKGGTSKMRLQMHATDPRLLEPKLGNVASEGCIRIPATLNVFLDVHGVIDADYEAAAATGSRLWVLKSTRKTVPWPGRYMVIVDSNQSERPAWAAP